MVSHKTLLVIAIALSATLLGVTASTVEKRQTKESHDLVVGERRYGDRIVHQEKVEESYNWTGQKVIVTREIPLPYDYEVTQVRCLDQMTDGTGAEVTVTGGGPGLSYVNLRFKSQRWHGIYFTIEVYGKKR